MFSLVKHATYVIIISRMATFKIDFDGTCVTNDFPYVGRDIGAQSVLLDLYKRGHNLILYTVRSKPEHLEDAKMWFFKNGISLMDVNNNPEQSTFSSSRKVFADYCIGDDNVGTPTKIDPRGHKYVDWEKMRALLVEEGVL